jgi:predicted DNA-binding protein (UPF0251 family)
MAYSDEKEESLIDLASSKNIPYDELRKAYEILKERIDKAEHAIPISIFNEKLSGLETISKYLHENSHLSFDEISHLMNRSSKTIWQAWNDSKKKFSLTFVVKDFEITVPLSLFKNRKFSVLENIVSYLKDECNMKFSQIAELLKRDQRTVWTVYSRYKKKSKK